LKWTILEHVFSGNATGVYRYGGSLTTPPCSEGVSWYIRRTPTQFSKDQIAAFTAIYDHNNRRYRRSTTARYTWTRTHPWGFTDTGRPKMRTKTEWLKGFGIFITALTLPGVALAQTGAGHPEDMPERPKIYSPYVDRVAADVNLAEGVYWGDTHFIRSGFDLFEAFAASRS